MVVLAVMLTVVQAATVFAYMGGPIRAQIDGFEPTEHKVFYHLFFHDESGTPPQVFYFNLDAPEPTRPTRARSLEQPDQPGWGNIDPVAWKKVSKRLIRMRGLDEFEITLSVKADYVGVDSALGCARYQLRATILSGAMSRAIDLAVFGEPLVRVCGVYEIPGRRELLVVISYQGRAYGCEEIDLPVLIPAE